MNVTYRYLFTSNYSMCVDQCSENEACLSLNVWWVTKKCDLNNKSRLTSAACHVDETAATYMGMAREKGKLRYSI